MFSIFRSQKVTALNNKQQHILDNYQKINRPHKNQVVNQTKLVAVDFETTGLNAVTDEIISMGFCPIVDDSIRLADCVHVVVKTKQQLTSENVAIHGLTDDILRQGMTQKKAFLKFLELTKDHVIVAHYHQIEKTFAQNLAVSVINKPVKLSFIDTYLFAQKRMQRRQQVITQKSLRLFNLRKQLGLPHYKAHNALEDAISTAELYLAQKASLGMQSKKITLKDMGLFNYRS
ncbi:MAG: hypothetical protein GY808_03155 [Gammaproteobacteria bacterium]|nr:hypothetical protein [Gammaproteobacteria bacterium]